MLQLSWRLYTLTLAALLFSSLSWAGQETVLHSFTGGDDGLAPSQFLVADSAGNLYGTTYSGGLYNTGDCYEGCGVIFELSPNSSGGWTETVLYNFMGGNDGSRPTGVIFGKDGNLYGATDTGGSGVCDPFDCGTIFKLAHNSDGSWSESLLHTFTGGADGGFPAAGLSTDAAGNLYGTANEYGDAACLCGTVFKLSPTTSGDYNFSVLYTFTGGSDGKLPYGNVAIDKNGNLYSTTWWGGTVISGPCSQGCGTVFELSPISKTAYNFSVLHSFTGGADGGSPSSGVILDKNGNLYGTTDTYGVNKGGVAYKLSHTSSGWQEAVLYSFGLNGTGPEGPTGEMVFDAEGNLYGPAGGGAKTQGSIFKLSPASGTWKLAMVYGGFAYGLGSDPGGPLVLSSSGALYGAAQFGGSKNSVCSHGCGVVFKIVP